MNTGVWIGGEVIIDPTAAIAHGVLIQAEPNCRVVVGAGACIGMGAVVHAVGGDIVIGSGANLGAGVLVYGSLHIGNNACIGSATSVVNCSVPAGEIVVAGSLICQNTAPQTTDTPQPSENPAEPVSASANSSAPKPEEKSKADDPLRVHARMHLQQFLSKIFIQQTTSG